MARLRSKRTGRFLKAGSKRHAAPARRHRHSAAAPRKHTRRRVTMALAAPRRHRRHTYRRNPVMNPRRHRRHYRRNPMLGGIMSKATLKNVGFAVVGLAGTPMLTSFVARYLPATLISNKWAGYALKGGAAFGLSIAARKIAGREAGNAVLIGGLAYVTLGLIADFFPTLLGTGTATPTGRYLQKQPLLAGMGMYPSMRGPITAGAPSRLDPANRF
jgi:hypothetical protein